MGGSKKQHRGSLNHASLESGASDPAAKIRRWSTLPNVFKRGGLGAAVAAGGGGGVAFAANEQSGHVAARPPASAPSRDSGRFLTERKLPISN